MTSDRTSFVFRRYADAQRDSGQSLLERLLHFISADVGYADDIVGDLMEERSRRAAQDGARAATLWYVREALLAIPHLAWYAIHHGGLRGRGRVTILIAGAAFAATTVIALLPTFDPVPVRLEIDGQRGASAGTIIVNSRRPVFLSTRALDASGQPTKSTEVRYRRIGGAPISVSASGVVTCQREGDAIVRASLRGIGETVRIKCRPVREVRALSRIQLIVGDRPRQLPFFALDPVGVQVDELAGDLRVKDSSIVILKEGRLYPQSPGKTEITMRIGDGFARMQVTVLPGVTPP